MHFIFFLAFRVDLRSFRFIGNHFLLLMSHDFEEMNHTKSIYWKLYRLVIYKSVFLWCKTKIIPNMGNI